MLSTKLLSVTLTLICVTFVRATPIPKEKSPDIGPDTCGQDRWTLGVWFNVHGMPSLLEEPIPPLVHYIENNPYDDPANPPSDPDKLTGFCGMAWSTETDPDTGLRKYRLENFPSEEATREAGFNITHKGQCGACSSLQDLGVYISRNLTESTRYCGFLGIISADAQRNCLKKLGFSDMCASIWEFNIQKTRKSCFAPCIWAWIRDTPFNNPDGSLNDCLQCDEDKAGPNFKYFSGRTRRNSGIPSAIYRPPQTIYNMTHCYWYGELV